MHSSEVKEDTHDSFRRITAEVICAGENELRVRVAGGIVNSTKSCACWNPVLN